MNEKEAKEFLIIIALTFCVGLFLYAYPLITGKSLFPEHEKLMSEREINDSLKTLKKEILMQKKKDSILILNNELQRIRQSNINN